MDDPAKSGTLDRLRVRYGWLGHGLRAYDRFSRCKGGGTFFAAGLTYYTIFALFPLLMVGFAVGGYALSRQPALLEVIDDRIRSSVSSELGQQLVDLMNAAIAARASVGVIGLVGAAWAGLGWMSHLRQSLSEMWDQPVDSTGFVRTKLSDLFAIVGTFVVIMASIALSALGQRAPMAAVLRWLRIPEFSMFDEIFRGVSVLISLLVSGLLFTWMIARLPRKPVSLATPWRAGLMAAVGFELFKQLGSIYLQMVLRSPAGATFGPVLGLMVFAFVTWSLVLFAAAWAATESDDPRDERVDPPGPVIIAPRVQVDEGLSTLQIVTAMAVGAIGALTFSRLTRWRRRGF